MICRNCTKYPFCKKTTKASDGCDKGKKRKLEKVNKFIYSITQEGGTNARL